MLYQHEIAMSDKGGIHFSPGHEIFVKLTRQNIKRLGTPYGTCMTALSQLNTGYTLNSERMRANVFLPV